MAGDFFISTFQPKANIKVLGLGGCGGNAIRHMVEQGLVGAELIAANTDLQALSLSKAPKTIQLGERIAGGLGAGCDPEVGKKATEESIEEIQQEINGLDMLFITGGLGGGTGTGSMPVVAQIAKELGVLTVAVVTKPFIMEGTKKMKIAEEGLLQLEEVADSVIVIPNQKAIELDRKIPFKKACELINNVLFKAVKGIVDLIQFAGFLNLDMKDVRRIMKGAGRGIIGMGHASGENKVQEAVEEAISNPLVENNSIEGCTGAIINISMNPEEFTMDDFETAVSAVSQHAAPDAEIKTGVVERNDFHDEVYITVIATGFDNYRNNQPANKRESSTLLRTSRGQEARTTLINSSQSRVRRITDVNQMNIPMENDSHEVAISEDLTSIPAFITHIQKLKK